MAEDAPIELPDEEIMEWRYERFRELGLDGPEAWAAALSDVDTHDLARLIGQGCGLEVALAILT